MIHNVSSPFNSPCRRFHHCIARGFPCAKEQDDCNRQLFIEFENKLIDSNFKLKNYYIVMNEVQCWNISTETMEALRLKWLDTTSEMKLITIDQFLKKLPTITHNNDFGI